MPRATLSPEEIIRWLVDSGPVCGKDDYELGYITREPQFSQLKREGDQSQSSSKGHAYLHTFNKPDSVAPRSSLSGPELIHLRYPQLEFIVLALLVAMSLRLQ